MTATITPGTLLGAGGVPLYYEEWLPAAPPAGVLVFAHGGNNYCGLPPVQAFARTVSAAGHAVVLYDQRGFGRSGGRPMHVARWREPRADLKALLHIVHHRHSNLPVTVAGCSYGALVAADQAITAPHLVDGVILMSLSTQPLAGPAATATRVLGALGRVFPTVTLPADPPETFPGAKAALTPGRRQRDLWADALCPPTLTLGLVRQVIHLRGRGLAADLPQLTAPVLLQAGADDTIAPPDPALVDRTGAADRTFRLYDRSGHDLLAGPDRDRVTADVIAWLDDRSSHEADTAAHAEAR